MRRKAQEQPRTPLADLAVLPLRPAGTIAELGATLVVASHPDDEALGCGGAIALLRRAGCPVRVLVVSDGTQSHPGSRRYPAPALRALREGESLAGLAALGVAAEAVTFLRMPDRAVPMPTSADFPLAVARCRDAIAAGDTPTTVLLPWRRDPHPDHHATSALTRAAVAGPRPPRLVEYPIWLWELAAPDDAPTPDDGEVTAWRLDIGAVLADKLAAIAAHRSQTTDLIDDDPSGFRLGPDMLAHFARPWELYLEVSGEEDG